MTINQESPRQAAARIELLFIDFLFTLLFQFLFFFLPAGTDMCMQDSRHHTYICMYLYTLLFRFAVVKLLSLNVFLFILYTRWYFIHFMYFVFSPLRRFSWFFFFFNAFLFFYVDKKFIETDVSKAKTFFFAVSFFVLCFDITTIRETYAENNSQLFQSFFLLLLWLSNGQW